MAIDATAPRPARTDSPTPPLALAIAHVAEVLADHNIQMITVNAHLSMCEESITTVQAGVLRTDVVAVLDALAALAVPLRCVHVSTVAGIAGRVLQGPGCTAAGPTNIAVAFLDDGDEPT